VAEKVTIGLKSHHRPSDLSTYGLNGLGYRASTPRKLHSEYYSIFIFGDASDAMQLVK